MSSDDSVYKRREWYGAKFEPRLGTVLIDSYGYEICDGCLRALTKASVMVVGLGCDTRNGGKARGMLAQKALLWVP